MTLLIYLGIGNTYVNIEIESKASPYKVREQKIGRSW
jgi:hypothetical protein